MFAKIDVRLILKDHLDTLLNTAGTRRSTGDLVLFFGIPLTLAVVLILLGVRLGDSVASLLINALAIFAALLLNLLLLVHGLIHRYQDENLYKDARRVLRELYANVSFGVLVCILGIIPLVAYGFSEDTTVRAIVSGVEFFLVSNFLLTLLMILKRVHVLLSHAFKYPAGKA